jgi:hypothetical protein
MLIAQGWHRSSWIFLREAVIGESSNHKQYKHTSTAHQPPSLPTPLCLLRRMTLCSTRHDDSSGLMTVLPICLQR